MRNVEIIKKICSDCIVEGESLLKTKWSNSSMGDFHVVNPTQYVDLEKFSKWKTDCNVLINMLGDLSSPWDEIFKGDKNNLLVNAVSMNGGLKSIMNSLEKGYLIKIEDLVFAEAFSNLIEQSEYLYNQNYFLAAGVIARAVLEEKLRNICKSQNITFSKPLPTLSDFNNELYKVRFYDKIELKNIDFLISVGNSAAHNQPITKEGVKSLIDGINRILLKYN
jgi:hypothetical protein